MHCASSGVSMNGGSASGDTMLRVDFLESFSAVAIYRTTGSKTNFFLAGNARC